MEKTAKELANEYRRDSELLKTKSKEIKEFAEKAPRMIRIINANVAMLDYTFTELERFSKFHPGTFELSGV